MWPTIRKRHNRPIINIFIMIISWMKIPRTLAIRCEEAHMKCHFRQGCGAALRNYNHGCSGVLQGPLPTHCPEICVNSLSALVSTDEGGILMNCECRNLHCQNQKDRANICRPKVMHLLNKTIIPCEVAYAICHADAQCSTAFEYYENNCKSMFYGHKCTSKCRNSLRILRRQEKATKLKNCKCEGRDKIFCSAVVNNTKHLCKNLYKNVKHKFKKKHKHKHHRHHHHHHNTTTTTTTTSILSTKYAGTTITYIEIDNEIDTKISSACIHYIINYQILITSFLPLILTID